MDFRVLKIFIVNAFNYNSVKIVHTLKIELYNITILQSVNVFDLISKYFISYLFLQ